MLRIVWKTNHSRGCTLVLHVFIGRARCAKLNRTGFLFGRRCDWLSMEDSSDNEIAAPRVAKKRKAVLDEGTTSSELQTTYTVHESSNNKKNNRNERKRQLEKKRRDEVNNGLDKLMELLFEIDPKSRAESRERQMGTNGEGADTSLTKYNSLHALNRVDLIHRSTELLRTLHYENQDLKKLVAELSGTGGSPQAKSAPVDLMVPPPPPMQVPRMAAVGDPYVGPTQNMERSESAPVAILNALREQRQSLIEKQRSIDASLELIRSGRLSLPTTGPRREVSLDFGVANSLQRQAAAARREEEIRGLARFAASLTNNNNNSYDSHQHQESAQVLANLRKNRDDLLEDGSEQSDHHRDDALAVALRQQLSYPSRNQGSDFSHEELLAHIRNSQAQLASRELLLSGSRMVGGLEQSSSMSGQDRFMQLQDQRLVERLAMEARMPDSLARSRTLDPALLLRHSGIGDSGNSGGSGQHRMY